MIKVTVEGQQSGATKRVLFDRRAARKGGSRGAAASDRTCCEVTGSRVVQSVKGQEKKGIHRWK